MVNSKEIWDNQDATNELAKYQRMDNVLFNLLAHTDRIRVTSLIEKMNIARQALGLPLLGSK